MTDQYAVDLYELLPAFDRIQDAKQGYPLRAMLDVIAEQVDIVKRDVDGLSDDLFIETCHDWVIPYIGDLVANNPIHNVDDRWRADVAHTIYYRRRKGTLPMLEELARDVTGWPAHAVAFFEMLCWTQNMNHLKRTLAPKLHRRVRNAVDRVGTAHVRNVDAMDQVDTAFDVTSHTVDVRAIAQHEGWHNIRNVGFFLWRLGSYPLSGVTARRETQPNRFHFTPLGNPAPLFHRPEREAEETELAREIHVAGPIRPTAFFYHIDDFYGPDKSLAIYRGPTVDPDQLIPANKVLCKQLDTWNEPPAGDPDIDVAVDVRLGRLVFAAGEEPSEVTVYFNYGFSADVGGGPYDRRASVVPLGHGSWAKTVGKSGANYPSLSAALAALDTATVAEQENAVITITDNATYEEAIAPEAQGRLLIQAKDGCRPHLKLTGGLMAVTGSVTDSAVTLSGLLIEGRIELPKSLSELDDSLSKLPNILSEFRLLHSTVVPGGSLTEQGKPLDPNGISLSAADPKPSLEITIDSSIIGALRLPKEMSCLSARDSIIDGLDVAALESASGGPGPPTVLERTTVFGVVRVKQMTLASEVIFTDLVVVERTQEGCVRFSLLPDGESKTPCRFRCQPDLAREGVTCVKQQTLIRDRLKPAFTADDYGHPAYAQLSLKCAREIRTGAEDGSEMGVFQQLKQPQREDNLRIRLEEYLPFGLEAGLIYVT